jgi:hypothetical protein
MPRSRTLSSAPQVLELTAGIVKVSVGRQAEVAHTVAQVRGVRFIIIVIIEFITVWCGVRQPPPRLS